MILVHLEIYTQNKLNFLFNLISDVGVITTFFDRPCMFHDDLKKKVPVKKFQLTNKIHSPEEV